MASVFVFAGNGTWEKIKALQGICKALGKTFTKKSELD